jgi:hypothetical protein
VAECERPRPLTRWTGATINRSLGCEDIEFSPEDAGRSDPEFLYRILEEVIKAGATTINIPDTVRPSPPKPASPRRTTRRRHTVTTTSCCTGAIEAPVSPRRPRATRRDRPSVRRFADLRRAERSNQAGAAACLATRPAPLGREGTRLDSTARNQLTRGWSRWASAFHPSSAS